MKNLVLSTLAALLIATAAHAAPATTIEAEIAKAERPNLPATGPIPANRPAQSDTTCLKYYQGKCAPGFTVKAGKAAFLNSLQPIPAAN